MTSAEPRPPPRAQVTLPGHSAAPCPAPPGRPAPAATWSRHPTQRTRPPSQRQAGQHPARAIVPPPRLRAKPVAFSSRLQEGAGRASAGGLRTRHPAPNSSLPFALPPFPGPHARTPCRPSHDPPPGGAEAPRARALAPRRIPRFILNSPRHVSAGAAGWPVKERNADAPNPPCASLPFGVQRLEGARHQDAAALPGDLDRGPRAPIGAKTGCIINNCRTA